LGSRVGCGARHCCSEAGNINTGAVDDFNAAIPIARRYGARVHVDGAFGLRAAANPETAHLLADAWPSALKPVGRASTTTSCSIRSSSDSERRPQRHDHRRRSARRHLLARRHDLARPAPDPHLDLELGHHRRR